MRLESGWVEFPVGATTALAFRARAEAAGELLPAVVLVQEIWGVDEFIMDVGRRFAEAGYLAFAPDLYSLGGARPPELAAPAVLRAKQFLDSIPPSSWWDAGAREAELAALPPSQGAELKATFERLLDWGDMSAFVAVLRAAVAAAGADPAGSGEVGVAGWCKGGALVGSLACREPALRAAVVFYGAAPDAAEVPAVVCPVLGLYGGEDPAITARVPGFAAAMQAAGKQFTWHIYEGAPHAFFNDTRAAYTVSAARDAWAQTLAFLSPRLGGPQAERGETV